jgi:hypothetical protein
MLAKENPINIVLGPYTGENMIGGKIGREAHITVTFEKPGVQRTIHGKEYISNPSRCEVRQIVNAVLLTKPVGAADDQWLQLDEVPTTRGRMVKPDDWLDDGYTNLSGATNGRIPFDLQPNKVDVFETKDNPNFGPGKQGAMFRYFFTAFVVVFDTPNIKKQVIKEGDQVSQPALLPTYLNKQYKMSALAFRRWRVAFQLSGRSPQGMPNWGGVDTTYEY